MKSHTITKSNKNFLKLTNNNKQISQPVSFCLNCFFESFLRKQKIALASYFTHTPHTYHA